MLQHANRWIARSEHGKTMGAQGGRDDNGELPAARMKRRASVRQNSSQRYLKVASGSIPLLLITSDVRGEARNSISRLEASVSFEPATIAAENT
jgi:hypothetical protein